MKNSKIFFCLLSICMFCVYGQAQDGAKVISAGPVDKTAAKLPSQAIDISLPDTIYAVVGDKLQLFYRGMIKTHDPYFYDILVACSNGNQYPRYFEYKPVALDIGTITFNIKVKDIDNNVLGQKTCKLVTKAAVQSPAANKNILCVGDSLTGGGIWCQEASRRLIGKGGAPAGLALTNISFVGRKTGGGIGWEGTGGWTMGTYVNSAGPAYCFYVSGVTTPPAFHAVYTNNGITFSVKEINITEGVGTVRCWGSSGAPTAAGTLTRSSGRGDDTITFTSNKVDDANPFWNIATQKLDIKSYVDRYCNGALDVMYVLLSWNGQTSFRTDFTSCIKETQKLFNHIHAIYPQAKMKLMGIQLPSLNGGMGANYGAAGTSYSDTYGMVVTALNMNQAYQDFANQPGYADFVEFVNVASQFDSEHNMPESDVPVNSRSSKTEKRGTNGVHPTTEGYFQIADVVFRNFIANFCQ